MKKILSAIFIIIITISILQAQEIPEIGCTPNNAIAIEHLKYYLIVARLKDNRIEAGTNNIPVEQITHVDNHDDCVKLNAIISANARFKKIDDTSERTKFYYQTNDFFYIFWDYTDGKLRFGPKRLFIVINKETEEVYTCYT